MAPFSRPTSRAKRVLENKKASTAAKAPAEAVQGFLATQEVVETTDGLGHDESGESDDIDQAEFEHDTLTVQEMVFRAITQVLASGKPSPSTDQLRDAQAIMPAVSFL